MLFARWWSANSCELARIRTSWPTFTGLGGELSDLHGWDRVQGVVEPRCSCRDAVFSLRWGAISPRGAGPTRLGRMDAARREGRCWPRAIWCQRTPRVCQPRDRVRVRHALDGNLAHGYANRATECALGTPLTRTSPTGMPEAQRSARATHPFDGGGGVGGKPPTSHACGAQSCARSGGVADHALSRTAS